MKRVGECGLAGEDRVIRRIGGDGGDARQDKQSGERSVDAKGKAHETSQFDFGSGENSALQLYTRRVKMLSSKGRGCERFDSV
jgi:hypothetical protein